MSDFTLRERIRFWWRVDRVMLIRNAVDNTCLWLARHLPKTLRHWIVVRAFTDTSMVLTTKHPDEIGYKNVMDHMK
jgi:hypothetical protein